MKGSPSTDRGGTGAWLLAVPVVVLGLFLALPFAGLISRVSPREMIARLGAPAVVEALRLSLLTTLASTAIVALLGIPTAYLLTTREFRGRRLLETLLDLPMVLPPTVAGFALLMAFGRMGLAGRALSALGVSLPFTTLGLVVAQVFMAAPFFIAPARAGFASVDRRYLDAAATLRASEARTFLRVMLPLSMPSLLAGVAMCGARALGEFGATITFAGNFPGRTQTVPIAVYIALETNPDAAITLSLILLVVSVAILVGMRDRWLGAL